LRSGARPKAPDAEARPKPPAARDPANPSSDRNQPAVAQDMIGLTFSISGGAERRPLHAVVRPSVSLLGSLNNPPDLAGFKKPARLALRMALRRGDDAAPKRLFQNTGIGR